MKHSIPGFLFIPSLVVVLTMTTLTAHAQDDTHPGRAAYDKACAACHDDPERGSKAPTRETLQGMRARTLTYAINEGKMKTQASVLSAQEKQQLVEYLAGEQVADDSWVDSMMCGKNQTLNLDQSASVANFGFDKKSHRSLSAEQAGLEKADFADLELAWTLAFPGATTMRSQAAAVGSTLFLPVADAAKVFAVDISGKPCFHWVYNNPIPLRTSAAYGTLSDGRPVVAVSDNAANTHLLDARNGELLWSQYVGVSEYSITTGTPVIHNDKVIVPVSQYEITLGGNPKHKCCTSHGAVVMIDAKTGEKLWTAHALPDAEPVRDRGDGKMLWGPSGAPIWSSPTVDEKRGLIYVGTGEATSEPAHKHTDAILAIDMKTGEIVWSFQATANDIFVSGCYRREGLNCPKQEDTVARDVDFGASVIIAQTSEGKDILLAGQKSGTVWALDPDNNGKVLWRRDIGKGSPLGGIHWGIAYDGNQVFAPINRPYGFRPEKDMDPSIKPGIYALDVDTGEINWSYKAEPNCTGNRKQRMPGCNGNIGFSGAPTVIDGVVVSGTLDGYLRAFDKDTGELLFEFDTSQNLPTVNGIDGKGGAIDNASIIAANGYLFVNSGYGMFGQAPGNLVLAFKVPSPE